LDVLRGVAILLVISEHMVLWHTKAGWAAPLAKALQCGGWTGVDLFFVLSGFLIGGLLFKEIVRDGTLDARRFLIRRAFKIWPAYFVFLAFVAARLVRHSPTVIAGLRPLVPNLFHVQNYFTSAMPLAVVHTWSLAAEEHFYLALPLLLLGLCRLGKLSWVPAISALIAIACLGMRLMRWADPFLAQSNYVPTHLRADSLFFGVLLAYVYHLRPAMLAFVPRFRLVLFLVGLTLVVPMFFVPWEKPFVFTFGYTLNYLGYGCVLIASVDATTGPLGWMLTGRMARGVGFVGLFSYSIYLWHFLARDVVLDRMHSMEQTGAGAFFLTTAAHLALSVALGVTSAKLVEQPFLALRDRMFPGRRPLGPGPAFFPGALSGQPPTPRKLAA
jgi:peptidoglycan/LPS O-acetylase OafA/YrhL